MIGGGAGGLELVTRLGETLGKSGQAKVILVDRVPIHIWKPHLHEVAAGSLDVGLHRLEYVAQARWHHFEFQLGPLLSLDRAAQTVRVGAVADSDQQPMLPERTLHYDKLIVALGSQINTFNIPGAGEHAIGLDSVYDAERFRQKLIAACMRAELRASQAQPHEVSIAIIGYVQTKPSRPYTMTKWIPSATWDPVPGGLCSNGKFLADMDRLNDLTLSWYKLPIFGELGLNNRGSTAARDKRKVSFPSQSRIRIQCRLVTVVFVCRGKQQPIRPRKELSERPSGNK